MGALSRARVEGSCALVQVQAQAISGQILCEHFARLTARIARRDPDFAVALLSAFMRARLKPDDRLLDEAVQLIMSSPERADFPVRSAMRLCIVPAACWSC